jgi:hypothetical protein
MEEQLIQDIINYSKTHELIKPMYLDFNENVTNIDKTKTTSRTYGEGVFAIQLKLFLRMNGFEGWRCAADSDLMNRLYKNNVKLTYTKNIGFYRRIHKNSLTQHPETSLSSKMRGMYYSKSKNKKTFGPLDNLVTEPFEVIQTNKIIDDETEKFILAKRERETLLKDVLKLNIDKIKTPSKVDYDVINNILNRSDIYHPSKNIKQPKENKPQNRNEIFELKKGTLAAQNKEFLPKRLQVNHSNNPWSRKSRD